MTGWVWLILAQAGAEPPPPVVHAQRLDEVGPVVVAGAPDAKLILRHRTLPAGSFAEVTNLENGRTVVVEVQPYAPATGGDLGALTPAAGRALGLAATPVVRIRPAVPSPAEQAAIRTGSVVARLDTPPFLLAALRRRLTPPAPPVVPVAVPTPKPAPPPIASPTPAPRAAPPKEPAPQRTGRWFVQVATLSDAARAASLAKSVDGVVRSAGRLYRVQAGPFATRAAADTARAAIARRGFGDARTIAQD